VAEGGRVLRGVGVGRGQAIGDGGEVEVGEERMRRWWLYSVLMKVARKPLVCRILASFISGVVWPCAGNGRHTACGLSPDGTAEALISATEQSELILRCLFLVSTAVLQIC
jgi:hypothetical protein